MSKRLFIAIPIKAQTLLRERKAFLVSNLSEEKINWVKEANMHLTLKFIGKTSNKIIPEIIEAIDKSVKNMPAFPMQLERIGIFGSNYHARVIWMGIKKNDQLLKLYRQLLQEMEGIGFLDDRQNFVPHLTLGRVKQILHKDHFKRVMERAEKGFIQETLIDEVVLLESILTPDGPIYKSVKNYKLGD